jgi:hypothetical protein
MRNAMIVIIASFFGLLVYAQETNQSSKPAPEFKKLTGYLGQWRYEGEYKASPFGPAMKVAGTAVGEMILGGFFFEWRWKEQPGTQGFEVIAYDEINKNFSARYYADDGTWAVGVYVFDSNQNSYTGKLNAGSKQVPLRVAEIFGPDHMSFTQKMEISVDGKNWKLLFEGKFTKTNVKTK